MTATIYWVEDDGDILQPVIEAITDAGYRVELLYTIKEAMEAKERLRAADLIMLDMFVPLGAPAEELGLNFTSPYYTGRDLLRWLRKWKDGIKTPVLVFTVANDPQVLADLKNLEADVVFKPVLPDELIETIEHIMTARHLKR